MQINATMIVLPVKDINETIKYYHDKFGFTVTEMWPKENPNYALLSNENNHLGFIESSASTENNKATSINFDVNNIDDVYTNIKDELEIIDELSTAEYNRKEFSLLDCNGYTVILGQYIDIDETDPKH